MISEVLNHVGWKKTSLRRITIIINLLLKFTSFNVSLKEIIAVRNEEARNFTCIPSITSVVGKLHNVN